MKYRIVEKMGKFYPESKWFLFWIDRGCGPCSSFEEANEVISRAFAIDRKYENLKKKGVIIHAPNFSNQHSEE